MDKNDIDKLIKEMGNDVKFFGKANEEKINAIEQDLHVKLPNSYKWFLKEFGLVQMGVNRAEVIMLKAACL